MSAGASPQTPLGKLTALPHTPSWFQGGCSAAGGEWRGGEGRTGEGEEGKGGERGNEEVRGKGGSWGIAPWLLGDRRHCHSCTYVEELPPQLKIFLTAVVERILRRRRMSAKWPPTGTTSVMTRCGSADNVPLCHTHTSLFSCHTLQQWRTSH